MWPTNLSCHLVQSLAVWEWESLEPTRNYQVNFIRMCFFKKVWVSLKEVLSTTNDRYVHPAKAHSEPFQIFWRLGFWVLNFVISKYFSKCISKCFSTWVFNFPDVQGYAMKCYDKNPEDPQPAITYSKLTIETLEQGMKYVQR